VIASSGNVSQWTDQSPVGNDAVQASGGNQPTLTESWLERWGFYVDQDSGFGGKTCLSRRACKRPAYLAVNFKMLAMRAKTWN
jgi:hypothetical protein